MIEELKTLLDAVASIPALAVWVAFGFLIYKLFIWGSVVAALLKGWQLAVAAYDKRSTDKVEQARIEKLPTVNEYTVDDISITGCEASLRAQITRLAGKRTSGSHYIHSTSVAWLREAIDEKEQRDLETGQK